MKIVSIERYIIPKSLYIFAAERSDRYLMNIEIIVIVFITAITTV